MKSSGPKKINTAQHLRSRSWGTIAVLEQVMRIIPTAIHGVMDFLGGILLIAAPWLFGFPTAGAATWALVGAGSIMLVVALLTDYELGAVRQIPMKMHLTMDAVLGLLLA